MFLILAALFWAGNFVFGRELVQALPPVGVNLIRWCVACAVLVPLTLLYEGRGFLRPLWGNPRLCVSLVLMALSGVLVFNSLVYLALTETTSVNAALINGTTPILTMVLAVALGGLLYNPPYEAPGAGADLVTGRRVLGALICLSGVAWIVSQGSLEVLASLSLNRGDALMLVAALSWAFYTVLSGRVTREISPLAATTVSALISIPLLAVIGGGELAAQPGWTEALTPVVVFGLLYMGTAASVAAFLCWSTGIGRLGASRGSIFLNLVPVFTAAIAVPALGEQLVVPQLAGGLLVIAGVVLVSRNGGAGPARHKP